ncbi:MAG: hypothetical protein IPJ07_06435 [Acidobacteria bacterium]|nr:hypothetical protein [Acidobacteriota bacterium]
MEPVSGNTNSEPESVSNEPSSSEEVRYYYRTEGIDRILQILKRGGVAGFPLPSRIHGRR